MTRVLVTGAAGSIGRHAVAALVARGCDVHAVTRSSHPTEAAVEWHSLDLADRAAVDAVIASVRPTHLLHLAWSIRGDYWNSRENVRMLRDSLHLVDRFIESGGRRIVGAGTSVEYYFRGEADLSESSPLEPDGLYAVCKDALREVAGFYCARRSVSFAWGRVFFCYGPGEHSSRTIPTLLDALERQERVPFQAGTGIRDYVYVKDVADAFATLVCSDVDGAVNVASGTGVTLRSFVEAVAEAAGRPGAIDLGALPTPAYEPVRVVADISRIQLETGWRPRWSLRDGIRDTVAWWRAERTGRATLG